MKTEYSRLSVIPLVLCCLFHGALSAGGFNVNSVPHQRWCWGGEGSEMLELLAGLYGDGK